VTIRVLHDLADFQNGRAFRPDETRAPTGLPVIKIAEMNKGIGELTGVFSGAAAQRHRIEPGDLLFAWSGTIVVMRWVGPPAVLNQHIFKVEARPDVDQRYLQYLLESLIPTFDLIVLDQKTTMGHVKVSDLKRIQVDVPPRQEQQVIGATLAAIDDKIESNRRLITLVPNLVRAYVDGALADAGRETAVSSLARFVNGGANTNGASGTGRMVLRIAELNSGPGGSTVYSNIQVPDDQTACPGDILMSWSGSLGVYRWFRDEAVINQHIFKVIPNGYPAWLVFDRLEAAMPVFQGIAKDKATTMGHIQRGHLESTTVPVPEARRITELRPALDALWARLLVADREVVRLEALRDALLPELLSGRIRVPEAQEAVA